ncbi:concanavalin A-like lectin/glucanase domain-containing protein [Trametes polyzona]|nr:concanavalin A-like lectin/glucanase domain-containing protein [Trametes polyzona]
MHARAWTPHRNSPAPSIFVHRSSSRSLPPPRSPPPSLAFLDRGPSPPLQQLKSPRPLPVPAPAPLPVPPVAAPGAPAVPAVNVSYNLAQDFSGPNFFDGWDFYGSWDNLTLSNVFWVDQPTALNDKLAYVNQAGNAILRVDNTTNVKDAGADTRRNTVRITSKDFYDYGSLWVFDATHVPFGCTVWPAFWTKGPVWPDNGEIDILEAVNLMDHNQMAIHTLDGCATSAAIAQTGQLGAVDCGSNSGCTVEENKPASYGDAFNAAQGGVWATKFDVDGISIWFWSRPDVPAELTGKDKTVDISKWGVPSAAFPVSPQCDLTKYFTHQQLVIDIALCGVWAGPTGNYQQTCPGVCDVSGPGSPAFDKAWFEIQYVRAYTTGVVPTPTPSAASAPAGASATATSPAQASGGAGEHGGSGSSSGALGRRGSGRGTRAGAVAVVFSVIAGMLLAVS